MDSIKDYINEENLIKDEIYQELEGSIICIICLDIIIEQIMCMKCQHVYCTKCIQNWSKINNKCPNRCQNPNYKICLSIGKLLSKLFFNCKYCKSIINFYDMKKHFLSKCKLGKNIDNNEEPYSFQKIDYDSKDPEMNLTSKL